MPALCVAFTIVADPAQAASTTTGIPVADSPNVVDWLSLAALWFTALGVVMAGAQIWVSRKAARIERTRAFQERYQADGFRQSASLAIGATGAEDTDSCIDFIKAWSLSPSAMARVIPSPTRPTKASIQDIELTLNLFEEMGTAHKLKQLDEKTIEMSLATNIVQIFSRAWWLICWLREGHHSGDGDGDRAGQVYVEFEVMDRAIRTQLPTLMDDLGLRPAAGIRVLCLPHGCAWDPNRRTPEWSAARSLSRSLSTFIKTPDPGRSLDDRLASLTAQLEALHDPPIPSLGPAPTKWDVILVPTTIDQPFDAEWEAQFSAAVNLAHAFDRCADDGVLHRAVDHLERAVEPRSATVDANLSRNVRP